MVPAAACSSSHSPAAGSGSAVSFPTSTAVSPAAPATSATSGLSATDAEAALRTWAYERT